MPATNTGGCRGDASRTRNEVTVRMGAGRSKNDSNFNSKVSAISVLSLVYDLAKAGCQGMQYTPVVTSQSFENFVRISTLWDA